MWDEVLEGLSKCYEFDKTHPHAYQNLAFVHNYREDYKEAKDVCNLANNEADIELRNNGTKPNLGVYK